MSFLFVALGAAVGAPLRYLVDRAVRSRRDPLFPWGTFAVNVTGSFALGVLAGAGSAGVVPDSVAAVLGAGLCGAFTTYSTLGWETLRLFERRARLPAVANAVASILAGLGAAFAGVAAAGVIWG